MIDGTLLVKHKEKGSGRPRGLRGHKGKLVRGKIVHRLGFEYSDSLHISRELVCDEYLGYYLLGFNKIRARV